MELSEDAQLEGDLQRRMSAGARKTASLRRLLESERVEIIDVSGQPWGPKFEGMGWDGIQGSGPYIRMLDPRILWEGRFLQRGRIALVDGS